MIMHSIPFITSAINFLFLSNTIGYFSDFWMSLCMAMAYLLFSYIWTKNTGYQIYSFLTWESGDTMSLVFAAVVPIMSVII